MKFNTLATCVLAGLLGTTVMEASHKFVGTDGVWNTAGNWTESGVPSTDSTDSVQFRPTGDGYSLTFDESMYTDARLDLDSSFITSFYRSFTFNVPAGTIQATAYHFGFVTSRGGSSSEPCLTNLSGSAKLIAEGTGPTVIGRSRSTMSEYTRGVVNISDSAEFECLGGDIYFAYDTTDTVYSNDSYGRILINDSGKLTLGSGVTLNFSPAASTNGDSYISLVSASEATFSWSGKSKADFELLASNGQLRIDEKTVTNFDSSFVFDEATSTIKPIPVYKYPVTADARLRFGSYVNNNYGADGAVYMKKGYTSDWNSHTIFKFDTSGYSEENFSQAVLNFHIYQADTNATLSIYTTSTTWDEMAVTGGNAPANGLLVGSVDVPQATPGWYSVDISGFLNLSQNEQSFKIVVTSNVNDISRYTAKESGSDNSAYIAITPDAVTPVIGLESVLSENLLQWQVENEVDVKEYQVVDSETGEIIQTVSAGNLEYQITLTESVENPVIVVIDKNGYTQHFAVNNKTAVILNLKKGWNLISLPFACAIDALPGDSFWTWNGQRYEEATELSALQGTWIFSTELASLELNGNVADKVINLTEGWNLIGPANNYLAPEDFLIWGWDDGYNFSNVLSQGKGYWIYSEGAKIINFD